MQRRILLDFPLGISHVLGIGLTMPACQAQAAAVPDWMMTVAFTSFVVDFVHQYHSRAGRYSVD